MSAQRQFALFELLDFIDTVKNLCPKVPVTHF